MGRRPKSHWPVSRSPPWRARLLRLATRRPAAPSPNPKSLRGRAPAATVGSGANVGMTNRATPGVPLELGRIDHSRAEGDTVCLHLTGRWLDPAGASEEELLVVQVGGRRHRFPATRKLDPKDPQRWSATFRVPAWAEPRQDGQAALWLGSSVIPVPLPAAQPRPGPNGPAPDDSLAEVPRSGPLADLLLKEQVAALHAELAQRTAEATRLRAQLADARSELESRVAAQAALEATHEELRGQLEHLATVVEDQ